jgi:hypothetical protein
MPPFLFLITSITRQQLHAATISSQAASQVIPFTKQHLGTYKQSRTRSSVY